MDHFRGVQNAESSGARGAAAAGTQPRKAKKKTKASGQQNTVGSAPQPYLATAPASVTNLTQEEIEAMASRSMILPSTYVRPPSRPSGSQASASGSSAPKKKKKKQMYASGLVAPPAIMPGGQPPRPRPQTSASSNQVPRRAERIETLTPAPGTSDNRRRELGTRAGSTERLRDIGGNNASMMSLGHLGQIFESDPMESSGGPLQTSQAAPQRRRRRIVRGDQEAVRRRPTVSSVEEGRALGLARGASMRRTNVWDDLPETSDPPPAFPFPVASTAQRPPSFEVGREPVEGPLQAPGPNEGQGQISDRRPRSPPPSFEQAIGLVPLGPVAAASPAALQTALPDAAPSGRRPSEPQASTSSPAPAPAPVLEVTRASTPDTDYASAPSSPVMSEGSMNEYTEEEREDRRCWNADLLAGYTLEQRVRREIARKKAREAANGVQGAVSGSTSVPPAGPSASATTRQTEESVPKKRPSTPKSSKPVAPVRGIEESSAVAGETSRTSLERQAEAVKESGGEEEKGEEVIQEAVCSPRIAASPNPSVDAPVVSAGPLKTDKPVVPVETVEPSEPTEPSATPGPEPIEDHPRDDTHENEDRFSTPLEQEVAAEPVSPVDITRSLEKYITISSQGHIPPVENIHINGKQQSRKEPGEPARGVKEELLDTLQTPRGAHSLLSGTPSPQAESEEIEFIASTPHSLSPEPPRPQPTRTPRKDSPAFTAGKTIVASITTTAQSEIKPTAKSPILVSRRQSLRRSTSSPALSPVKSTPAVVDKASPVKPLFARPAFVSQVSTEATRRGEVSNGTTSQRREPQVQETWSRKLKRMASQPNISSLRDEEEDVPPLPPHREAALKRRELAIKRAEPVVTTGVPVKPAPAPVQPTPASARPTTTPHKPSPKPANKFTPSPPAPKLQEPLKPDPPPAARSQVYNASSTTPKRPSLRPPVLPKATETSPGTLELRNLAASTAQLLQFLEQSPTAGESSAQGAAKATLSKVVEEELAAQQSAAAPLPRRKPPPPPSLRTKSGSATVTPRRSVLSTADSPLMPSPTISSPDQPTPQSKAPQMPTRRPPPPPPPPLPIVTGKKTAPPPPPPPAFHRGQSEASAVMSTGSSVDSSVSERGSEVPLPFWPMRPPRVMPTARPRGPRPPPVPPRPWARRPITTEAADQPRPAVERTRSETTASAVPLDSEDSLQPEGSSPVRSTSEQNLRSAANAPQPEQEYTDVDLFVSRLEGSGREYEGLSHLSEFLGPAKDPGASEAALEQLLPGLVQVDSRRTNAAGKVKLKLSLLGVRVTKCPICLNQYRDKDRGVILPECGHSAHEVCARRWFKEDHKCFVCRAPLREVELVL